MAEECGVAISSSSTQLTQQNWWDLVSSTNPWQQQQQQQQLNQKYSNSSNNNCDDVDQDVSISSTSFTNASNHSSLSVDSSRRLLADQRSASSNDDLINGEQVSDNHIWNHVLLSVNTNHDLRNNDHGVGENFIDALPSKGLSTHHVMYDEPACDYLKKLDNNSTWEFTNSAASNFNNFEKQINGGFMDNNMNISIENERLTKLSNLVSSWSIAPPEPQPVLNNFPPHQVMDHDHHYSQPNLCHLKPQPFFNDSTSSCNPQMGITNRNSASSLFSCYRSQNMKVDDQNHGHPNGIEYQIGLDNPMAADHHNSKYFNGNGSILPDSYSSCTSTNAARNFADVISFTSRLGNKPLNDLHAPKPCFKSFNSSDHSKKQNLQTSSSARMSGGRGQGIANEGKKKRTDDTSSETVVKKLKQETSTVSSAKMQAPKVKLGDRITALQQIVSPFGKTDTASVLYEAIQYIKFLQEQVHVDWEDHSSALKPSRVLKKSRTPRPPPIESFAIRLASKPQRLSHDDEDSDSDCVEIKHELDDDDFDCVVIKNELEDDDADEVLEARPVNRGRRFMVEDEDSDGDWANIESTSEEEEEEVEELEDDDVVGKALQKCAKISTDLRNDLHGSSAPAVSDQYAEVEAAPVRIVNQVPFLTFTELLVDDIIEACRSEDSDFQPILKPYRMVGVNFLLLLYQKGIGGAILADGIGLGKTIQLATWFNGKEMVFTHCNLTKELWSMLEFMMPDLFTTEDVDLKKLLTGEDRDLIGRMKSILGPFILRRLKSDVMQQLVPKIQRKLRNALQVEYVIMDKEQDAAYKEAIEEYRAASRARIAKTSEVNSNSILKVLPWRQISNYFVQFLRRIYSDEDVVPFARKLHPMGAFGLECTLDKVIGELKNYSDYSIHRLLLYYGVSDKKGLLPDKYALLSSKSQWTSMLDVLEWTLDVIGVTYRRLDGSTQVTERQTIVDTFNNDTSIFACLLSTRAGGQGLDLVGADTVVIHDVDFNPQIDRQAEDRCHCIGQVKPVTIYRLVTKGTVDENVYEIAKRKLVLDVAVLESGVEMDNEGDTSTMGDILSKLLLG
ncbi:hypothetical protein C1H46_027210 [Malus baccata]|uniref:Helicase C-terminal domain-containing protein n=1 Tax=Malus baccata TaxID=106549 RepID=A0A540LLA3_MALBA|nr:hypothetical protein C1H46_027210 [Malus baccata]